VTNGILLVRTAIAIFAVLLILFAWLDLLLALEIGSTGREIQSQMQELERLKRDNATLRLDIAEAKSPAVLESRALELGYKPQEPDYLVLSQPPIEETTEGASGETSAPQARSRP
jgi:hypothetical protein